MTEYHSRNLFLIVLEAPADLMPGEVHRPPGSRDHLSVSSKGGRRRELSGVSFTRTLIPFRRAPPPKGPTS